MPSVLQERTGVWSPRTASIDWCEENYQITPWVAEFWNTVSNISMIIPPLYGIYSCYKLGLETRYVLSYLLFLMVGIGSTLFHMTLKYPMQLLDELPMIYTTCMFIYALAVVKEGPGKQRKGVIAGLILYAIAFTVIYAVHSNPLIHEVMYGILVFFLIFQAFYLMYHETNSTSNKLAFVGVMMYAIAFLLWNIDNNFCHHLKKFRGGVSYPVGVLSELHAWWHLLVGYSTYLHIIFSSHYRLKQLKRNPALSSCLVGVCVVKDQ
eukprot:TRINITY_DN13963_c0_g1_i1.p1 TRINITY_DN13963_c0_g1~~TRINITY_DN13963_c0_g1_i1.p1  ORF type:complete len:265 (-),score=4.86 TRINITY_DN13963_c0_g1_i1:257-1051(-)